jgi:hypothetical protein
MDKVTSRTPKTILGVQGVTFATNARQETPAEAALQRIQAKLADGEVLLPSPTDRPHLFLVSMQVVDAPSITVICLWVPSVKEAEAEGLLKGESFVLEG